MASLNKVHLIGNLGGDPELRYTQNQTPVCTLSIATTESRNDSNGQKQDFTTWHRVVVWGRQAENCSKYLAKGRQIFIEGRLQTRQWEDQNGSKRYTTEIVAQNVQFLGSNRGAGDSAERPAYQQNSSSQGQGDQNFGNEPAIQPPQVDHSSLDDVPF